MNRCGSGERNSSHTACCHGVTPINNQRLWFQLIWICSWFPQEASSWSTPRISWCLFVTLIPSHYLIIFCFCVLLIFYCNSTLSLELLENISLILASSIWEVNIFQIILQFPSQLNSGRTKTKNFYFYLLTLATCSCVVSLAVTVDSREAAPE